MRGACCLRNKIWDKTGVLLAALAVTGGRGLANRLGRVDQLARRHHFFKRACSLLEVSLLDQHVSRVILGTHVCTAVQQVYTDSGRDNHWTRHKDGGTRTRHRNRGTHVGHKNRGTRTGAHIGHTDIGHTHVGHIPMTRRRLRISPTGRERRSGPAPKGPSASSRCCVAPCPLLGRARRRARRGARGGRPCRVRRERSC